jgi:hypothetical protein
MLTQTRTQAAWEDILGKDIGKLLHHKVEIQDEVTTSNYNLWHYPSMDALVEILLA